MNISNAERAEVLITALPYIKEYYNKIVVIKYGGSAMHSDSLKRAVMGDLVLLSLIGVKPVLVHGGGPELTETLKKMNMETRFENGLRVTDEATAQVAMMVLAGKINKQLVNMLENIGGRAVGLSGIDGHMLIARKLDEKLGFVGAVAHIDPTLILDTLNNGYIPVISSVGCDNDGNVYNVNADTAAGAIAEALKAESFISLTDTSGILADKDDEKSLIRVIGVGDIDRLVSDGTISGGMMPKVKSCGALVSGGVKKVFIIDGRVPHSILVEMLTDEGIGTMIV